MYDDMEVYGSDVVNFIKKHLGDYTEVETAPIYVNVITSLSEIPIEITPAIHKSEFTNNRYIKPTAKFVGHLVLILISHCWDYIYSVIGLERDYLMEQINKLIYMIF